MEMCYLYLILKYKDTKIVLLPWSKNHDTYRTVRQLYHYTPNP